LLVLLQLWMVGLLVCPVLPQTSPEQEELWEAPLLLLLLAVASRLLLAVWCKPLLLLLLLVLLHHP
jgi:hypothetical protein